MPRQPPALSPHPLQQVVDERSNALPADGEPIGGRLAIDLALDGEDRVDAPDRLDRERGDDRQLAARPGGDVGQNEELAPPQLSSSVEFSLNVGIENSLVGALA